MAPAAAKTDLAPVAPLDTARNPDPVRGKTDEELLAYPSDNWAKVEEIAGREPDDWTVSDRKRCTIPGARMSPRTKAQLLVIARRTGATNSQALAAAVDLLHQNTSGKEALNANSLRDRLAGRE